MIVICSATILVSEILPRGRNLFVDQTDDRITAETLFLDEWNAVAADVNYRFREYARHVDWLQTISHVEFHTMFGMQSSELIR